MPNVTAIPIRPLARGAALALFVAIAALQAVDARAADGVQLSVKRGPLAGDLTLDWTGGQPTFDFYRATSPGGLVAPGNLVTSTSLRSLSTPEGPDTLVFFIITSPCVIDLPERCDGVDNDCDGDIDEAGAESSCSLPNATAACVDGACAVDMCDGGYVDCDLAAGNGCEYAASGFPNDPANCGGCNLVCPSGPNAVPECTASTCGLICDPDYADCDVNPADGCEANLTSDPSHCGGCNAPCPSYPSSTPVCAASICSYVCSGSFVDCNAMAADGCEVDGSSFPTNSSHCGGCNNACTLPNAVGVCSAGSCQSVVAYCNPGYVDLNGSGADGCEYACTPTGVDLPDDTFADTNCDGIDGDIAAAVFVSPTGSDANAGTPNRPVRTIAHALVVAGLAGKTQVYVDKGLYSGTVDLVDGISLYGGYASTAGWSRSASNVSEIRGTAPSGGALRGVVGNTITSPTTLDLLKISTTNASGAGVSAYALHCTNCPAIVVKNCTLVAGNGAAGSAGAVGTPGATGGNGFAGGAGSCDLDVSGTSLGGAGGTSTCGRSGGSGGAGKYKNVSGVNGSPGVGPTGGGNGGTWGDPGLPGGAGSNGAIGNPGANGAGGSGGSIAGGLWVGSSGDPGTNGSDGNGGGGGGGGGGQYCTFCVDGTGNGGGGGGAGGCGGTGSASGGTGGGGSFGVFFMSTTGFTIVNSTVQSGTGGTGGAGVAGGAGGPGGAAGLGAAVCSPSEVGRGGNGGLGGAGGAGGASGGGAGGPSWAVYRSSSAGTISGTTLTPGTGGSGGTSPGNPGVAGASGTLF